jgi:hypothetical protein
LKSPSKSTERKEPPHSPYTGCFHALRHFPARHPHHSSPAKKGRRMKAVGHPVQGVAA